MYKSLHLEVQKKRSNIKNTGAPAPITHPQCPHENTRGCSSIALYLVHFFLRAGARYVWEME
jgi:hypothetical protein